MLVVNQNWRLQHVDLFKNPVISFDWKWSNFWEETAGVLWEGASFGDRHLHGIYFNWCPVGHQISWRFGKKSVRFRQNEDFEKIRLFQMTWTEPSDKKWLTRLWHEIPDAWSISCLIPKQPAAFCYEFAYPLRQYFSSDRVELVGSLLRHDAWCPFGTFLRKVLFQTLQTWPNKQNAKTIQNDQNNIDISSDTIIFGGKIVFYTSMYLGKF